MCLVLFRVCSHYNKSTEFQCKYIRNNKKCVKRSGSAPVPVFLCLYCWNSLLNARGHDRAWDKAYAWCMEKLYDPRKGKESWRGDAEAIKRFAWFEFGEAKKALAKIAHEQRGVRSDAQKQEIFIHWHKVFNKAVRLGPIHKHMGWPVITDMPELKARPDSKYY